MRTLAIDIGGQFDTQSQICRQSRHTKGWEGFRLADLFTVDSHGLGVRISGINDAQAAALAEARFYQKSVEFPTKSCCTSPSALELAVRSHF